MSAAAGNAVLAALQLAAAVLERDGPVVETDCAAMGAVVCRFEASTVPGSG